MSSPTSPLVFALDVGSTGTRGGLYDAAGQPLGKLRHKVRHAFTAAADGTSVIDADQIVAEVSEVIDTVLAAYRRTGGSDLVAGVDIDTFSSSLVGIGADGTALTPCYTYADSRSASQVAELRATLDEAAVQQRTGTRLHTSYLPSRLRWLRTSEPELWARVTRWISLSEYVHLRLLGETAAGTSVAAWSGMLDRHTADWDPAMLEAAGIGAELLSPVQHPGQTLATPVGTSAPYGIKGKNWKLLAEARWLPGLSDGYASNVGAGGVDARSAVISAATSGAMRVLVDQVPEQVGSGLWCYRVDAGLSVVGGALNDVGRAVSWLESTVQLPSRDKLAAALLADPESTTPLVLPFLTGERSTGWSGEARAVVAGLSGAHDGTALARGVFEGIALSYVRVADQLGDIAGSPERILAAGRVGSELPELLPVLADALQAPITPVTIKRATLRGTALITLDVVAPGQDRRPLPDAEPNQPRPGRADYYRDRLAAFEELYARLY